MKATREVLPESASLLLDVVRFSASILVVIAHVTHPEFRLGYMNWQILGDVAVPVFFVLSGFVIRYVTRTRKSTAREYFIDRASRIYSVVLPAMLFTLVVSGLCFLIDRPQFLSQWSATFSQPLLRIAFNLLFVSQAWGRNTIPFINSPFWSLGYECVYYALYGFLFFLRGWKRVALCAVVALILGPQVIFLLPVWWLGCWVYDAYVRIRGTRVGLAVKAGAGVWLAAGLVLYGVGFPGLLRGPVRLFEEIAAASNPLAMASLYPARATMFAVAAGLLSAGTLLVCLLVVDPLRIDGTARGARSFRHVANGTFTIYLMHYPFLVLLLFLGWIEPGHMAMNVGVCVAMCAVLTLAAVPIDRLKTVMRRWLRAHIPVAVARRLPARLPAA